MPFVAVVTGANRGLGLAISRALVARGVTVVGTTRQPMPDFLTLDIRNQHHVDRLRETLASQYDALDILINNAGSGAPGDAVPSQVGIEQLTMAIDTNCFGALRMVQSLLPLLRQSPAARIVNISSSAGALSSARQYDNAAYRLSKSCLNAVTAMLSRELSGSNVVVNAICPGHVRTRMGGMDAPRSPDESAEDIVWLALDAPASLRGRFIRGREPADW